MPAAEHPGVEPGALLDIADQDAETRDGSDRDHHRPSRSAVCRVFMRASLRDLAECGARLLRRFASCNDIPFSCHYKRSEQSRSSYGRTIGLSARI